MPKTLNEHADDLKRYIIELQSDAHNKVNVRAGRYNNLKLTMAPNSIAILISFRYVYVCCGI